MCKFNDDRLASQLTDLHNFRKYCSQISAIVFTFSIYFDLKKAIELNEKDATSVHLLGYW